MSFETMRKDDLYRTAVEDFAVDVKPTDSKQTILAAMLESGVTYDLYLAAHPEVAPPVVVEPTATVATNVITAQAIKEAPVVRTAEPATAARNDLYLVKMHRENPYFEFRGYKFTKKDPFVVMDAEATDAILEEEDGFAIAKPSEAAEYYAR